MRESVEFIRAEGAELTAFCVAVDRQERGQTGTQSALAELAATFALTPISIVTLDDILAFALNDPRVDPSVAPTIEAYRAQYGAMT